MSYIKRHPRSKSIDTQNIQSGNGWKWVVSPPKKPLKSDLMLLHKMAVGKHWKLIEAHIRVDMTSNR